MHEEDEEWLVEWINSCKDEKHEAEEDDNIQLTGKEKAFNAGIQKALDLYNERFYEYQGREIEKAEKELDEIEEELEKLNDPELIEYKEKQIEETRQVIDQMKNKRENFLKPMIEGDIEEAAEYNG